MRIAKKIVGWSFFFVLLTADSLPAQERNPQAIQESCRQSVQGFYDWFVGKRPKYPKAVLSPELRRRLKEDEENNMDEEGYIVGLDFDPLAAGNDICSHYPVGKIRCKGERYFVEVYCLWRNKKAENKKMAHEVMFNHGRWMIMNIHYYNYEKGKLTGRSDLLGILKRLREERRKTFR